MENYNEKFQRVRAAVIDVPVDVGSNEQLLDRLVIWGRESLGRYVVFANVHVVVTAIRDALVAPVIFNADLVAPDGFPIAWMVRKSGYKNQEKISGPDLMWSLLARCEVEKLSIYLYGGTTSTLDALIGKIKISFPILNIVGFESPPFRNITLSEDIASIEKINSSGASFLFVGLGCPKQEAWMASHRRHVKCVMLGVGAAFDFHAGTIERAPLWMRQAGLEWFHRLASEPHRLWRRYLITNSIFLILAIRQLWILRRNVNI